MHEGGVPGHTRQRIRKENKKCLLFEYSVKRRVYSIQSRTIPYLRVFQTLYPLTINSDMYASGKMEITYTTDPIVVNTVWK